jgi:uncharacterized membrane protein
MFLRRTGTIPLTRGPVQATVQVLMTSPFGTVTPSTGAKLSAPPSSAFARQQPALALSAIGLLGLGILGVVYGDFALVWQPVAAWVPGRTALAYLTAVLECITALSLLFPRTSRWAVRVLFPGVIIWQMLRLPALFAGPTHEGVYLGFGETAILFAGGFTLFARLADLSPGSRLAFLTSEDAVRIARLYFGLWIIPIGLSHFVYHDATIRLIPMWIPNRSFFAYLTGAGQIASGLGLLFNVLPRVAAYAEAAQLWIYAVLIWIPAVVLGPNPDVLSVFGQSGMRMPFTALLVTWFPAACALAVAQNVPSQRRV